MQFNNPNHQTHISITKNPTYKYKNDKPHKTEKSLTPFKPFIELQKYPDQFQSFQTSPKTYHQNQTTRTQTRAGFSPWDPMPIYGLGFSRARRSDALCITTRGYTRTPPRMRYVYATPTVRGRGTARVRSRHGS